jgi:excisionase family DNA binding protein
MSGPADQLLTTGEAARLLGSSRQHVVDLCRAGRLPHTSAGTHRRVRRSDVERLAAGRRRGLTRDQRRSLWLHRAIAGRIVEDPARHLRTARANLDVMAAAHPRGGAAAALRRWRSLLGGPLDELLEVISSAEPDAVELRQNTPFAGVLTDTQRAKILAAFRAADRDGR